MLRRLLPFCLLSTLAVAPSVGQQPTKLLRDINATGSPASSNPYPGPTAAARSQAMVRIGLYVYFVAEDPTRGVELHRSLGTSGGTEFLVDINQGPGDTGFVYPCALGTKLIFGGNDGKTGSEPWVFDTVTKTATQLADLYPGAPGSGPAQMTAIGKYVYFKAIGPNVGDELYRTDGTPQGTIFLKDINPGPPHSRPIYFAELGGKAYFTAGEASTGREIWVSDGTPAGTQLLVDAVPGTQGSQPQGLITWNNRLWFSAYSPSNGIELWSSDGTAQGTGLAFDIATGTGSASPGSFVVFQNQLYFGASRPATGRELYRCDGNSVSLVYEGVPGPGPGNATGLVVAGAGSGARLFFSSRILDPKTQASLGSELCCYDGSTVVEIDVNPGAATGGVLYPQADALGRLFFAAVSPTVGNELWVSDGTVAGTRLVKDIRPNIKGNPSLDSSFPRYLSRLATPGVVFAADDGSAIGNELWFSDGTSAGTRLIKDINTNTVTAASLPREMQVCGGVMYFSADDGVAGREPWETQGTAASTRRIADLHPGPQGSDPKEFVALGRRVFFSADAPDPATQAGVGRELWVWDAPAGAPRLLDLLPGAAGSNPTWLVAHGGRLFFQADAGAGKELWVSDGTAAGTSQVADILPGPGSSTPSGLVGFRGRLWFSAAGAAGDTELWSSDGSAAGTRREFDINPGSAGSTPLFLTVLGERLIFRAYGPSVGVELFSTDGTQLSALDILPGSAGSFPSTGTGLRGLGLPNPFSQSRGIAYFTANDSSNGIELWRSDGTLAGTRMVVDLDPSGSGRPSSIAAVGDGVFFNGNDGVVGLETWFSDGTAAGTTLLGDMMPGVAPSSPSLMTAAGAGRAVWMGRYYDAVANQDMGFEMFLSDGTATGTRFIDVLQPVGSAFPRDFRVLRGRVLFTADDQRTGRELHVLELGASSLPGGEGCSAARPTAQLWADDPRLGAQVRLGLRGAPARTSAVLAIGVPRLRGVHLGSGCELWPDFGKAVVLLGLQSDGQGVWSLQAAVPNSPASQGLDLSAQMALGPSSTLPLGLDLSNAVDLQLGR